MAWLNKDDLPQVDASVRGANIGFGMGLGNNLDTLRGQYLPQGQAELSAQQQLSPGYNQLMIQLLQAFGPQLAQAGVDINRVGAVGDANTNIAQLNALQAAGAPQLASGLNRAADPGYYAGRDQAIGGLQNYMSRLSPTLNGSELEQINRGLARTGSAVGAPSPNATLQNAMSFGSAGQDRLRAYGQGISQAAQTLQGLKLPGLDYSQFLGQNRPTPGLSQFQGITPLSQTTNTFGSQLLDRVYGVQDAQNDAKVKRAKTGEKINADINTASSAVGAFAGV